MSTETQSPVNATVREGGIDDRQRVVDRTDEEELMPAHGEILSTFSSGASTTSSISESTVFAAVTPIDNCQNNDAAFSIDRGDGRRRESLSNKQLKLRLFSSVNNKKIPSSKHDNDLTKTHDSSLWCRPHCHQYGCFDSQWKDLLRKAKDDGILQNNNKGPNWTLHEQVTLSLDLHDASCCDRMFVPLPTLRPISFRMVVVEAMWYLRGEAHINFLLENGCKFWSKQADDDNWIGLNYGLLTNWSSNRAFGQRHNQLETLVIQPLVAGMLSRNMTCSLLNPSEPTKQSSCTSSVQFNVRPAAENHDSSTITTNCNPMYFLDITVTQRSSDTLLGLPNDVAVWSIIAHLVAREVRMRCSSSRDRSCQESSSTTGASDLDQPRCSELLLNLRAGKMQFVINSGCAHTYQLNASALDEILSRQTATPSSGIRRPYFEVNSDRSMFELADESRVNKEQWKLFDYDRVYPKLVIEQACEN